MSHAQKQKLKQSNTLIHFLKKNIDQLKIWCQGAPVTIRERYEIHKKCDVILKSIPIELLASTSIVDNMLRAQIPPTACCLSLDYRARSFCLSILANKLWDIFIILVLGLDLITITFLTNYKVIPLHIILCICFAFEILLRTLGLGIFARDGVFMNWRDRISIVFLLVHIIYLSGIENIWLSVILSFRPLRIINYIPSMQTIVVSVLNSLSTVANISALFLIVLIGFSIAATHIFGDKLHYRCHGTMKNPFTPPIDGTPTELVSAFLWAVARSSGQTQLTTPPTSYIDGTAALSYLPEAYGNVQSGNFSTDYNIPYTKIPETCDWGASYELGSESLYDISAPTDIPTDVSPVCAVDPIFNYIALYPSTSVSPSSDSEVQDIRSATCMFKKLEFPTGEEQTIRASFYPRLPDTVSTSISAFSAYSSYTPPLSTSDRISASVSFNHAQIWNPNVCLSTCQDEMKALNDDWQSKRNQYYFKFMDIDTTRIAPTVLPSSLSDGCYPARLRDIIGANVRAELILPFATGSSNKIESSSPLYEGDDDSTWASMKSNQCGMAILGVTEDKSIRHWGYFPFADCEFARTVPISNLRFNIELSVFSNRTMVAKAEVNQISSSVSVTNVPISESWIVPGVNGSQFDSSMTSNPSDSSTDMASWGSDANWSVEATFSVDPLIFQQTSRDTIYFQQRRFIEIEESTLQPQGYELSQLFDSSSTTTTTTLPIFLDLSYDSHLGVTVAASGPLGFWVSNLTTKAWQASQLCKGDRFQNTIIDDVSCNSDFGEVCEEYGMNPQYGFFSFDNVGIDILSFFVYLSLENWRDVLLYAEASTASSWIYVFFIPLALMALFFYTALLTAVVRKAYSDHSLFIWRKTNSMYRRRDHFIRDQYAQKAASVETQLVKALRTQKGQVEKSLRAKMRRKWDKWRGKDAVLHNFFFNGLDRFGSVKGDIQTEGGGDGKDIFGRLMQVINEDAKRQQNDHQDTSSSLQINNLDSLTKTARIDCDTFLVNVDDRGKSDSEDDKKFSWEISHNNNSKYLNNSPNSVSQVYNSYQDPTVFYSHNSLNNMYRQQQNVNSVPPNPKKQQNGSLNDFVFASNLLHHSSSRGAILTNGGFLTEQISEMDVENQSKPPAVLEPEDKTKNMERWSNISDNDENGDIKNSSDFHLPQRRRYNDNVQSTSNLRSALDRRFTEKNNNNQEYIDGNEFDDYFDDNENMDYHVRVDRPSTNYTLGKTIDRRGNNENIRQFIADNILNHDFDNQNFDFLSSDGKLTQVNRSATFHTDAIYHDSLSVDKENASLKGLQIRNVSNSLPTNDKNNNYIVQPLHDNIKLKTTSDGLAAFPYNSTAIENERRNYSASDVQSFNNNHQKNLIGEHSNPNNIFAYQQNAQSNNSYHQNNTFDHSKSSYLTNTPLSSQMRINNISNPPFHSQQQPFLNISNDVLNVKNSTPMNIENIQNNDLFNTSHKNINSVASLMSQENPNFLDNYNFLQHSNNNFTAQSGFTPKYPHSSLDEQTIGNQMSAQATDIRINNYINDNMNNNTNDSMQIQKNSTTSPTKIKKPIGLNYHEEELYLSEKEIQERRQVERRIKKEWRKLVRDAHSIAMRRVLLRRSNNGLAKHFDAVVKNTRESLRRAEEQNDYRKLQFALGELKTVIAVAERRMKQLDANIWSLSSIRRLAFKFIIHPWFDRVAALIGTLQIFVMCFYNETLYETVPTMKDVIWASIILFYIELAIRLIGDMRSVFGSFVGIIDIFLSAALLPEFYLAGSCASGSLRLFRITSVICSLSPRTAIFEEKTRTLAKSIASLTSLVLVLILMLLCCAIVAWQTFSYTTDNSLVRNFPIIDRPMFEDVFMSFTFIFQVLTMEDWPNVMYNNMFMSSPVFSALFFIFIIIAGNWLFLSLFLAIMIDNYETMAEEYRQSSMSISRERQRRLMNLPWTPHDGAQGHADIIMREGTRTLDLWVQNTFNEDFSYDNNNGNPGGISSSSKNVSSGISNNISSNRSRHGQFQQDDELSSNAWAGSGLNRILGRGKNSMLMAHNYPQQQQQQQQQFHQSQQLLDASNVKEKSQKVFDHSIPKSVNDSVRMNRSHTQIPATNPSAVMKSNRAPPAVTNLSLNTDNFVFSNGGGGAGWPVNPMLSMGIMEAPDALDDDLQVMDEEKNLAVARRFLTTVMGQPSSFLQTLSNNAQKTSVFDPKSSQKVPHWMRSGGIQRFIAFSKDQQPSILLSASASNDAIPRSASREFISSHKNNKQQLDIISEGNYSSAHLDTAPERNETSTGGAYHSQFSALANVNDDFATQPQSSNKRVVKFASVVTSGQSPAVQEHQIESQQSSALKININLLNNDNNINNNKPILDNANNHSEISCSSSSSTQETYDDFDLTSPRNQDTSSRIEDARNSSRKSMVPPISINSLQQVIPTNASPPSSSVVNSTIAQMKNLNPINQIERESKMHNTNQNITKNRGRRITINQLTAWAVNHSVSSAGLSPRLSLLKSPANLEDPSKGDPHNNKDNNKKRNSIRMQNGIMLDIDKLLGHSSIKDANGISNIVSPRVKLLPFGAPAANSYSLKPSSPNVDHVERDSHRSSLNTKNSNQPNVTRHIFYARDVKKLMTAEEFKSYAKGLVKGTLRSAGVFDRDANPFEIPGTRRSAQASLPSDFHDDRGSFWRPSSQFNDDELLQKQRFSKGSRGWLFSRDSNSFLLTKANFSSKDKDALGVNRHSSIANSSRMPSIAQSGLEFRPSLNLAFNSPLSPHSQSNSSKISISSDSSSTNSFSNIHSELKRNKRKSSSLNPSALNGRFSFFSSSKARRSSSLHRQHRSSFFEPIVRPSIIVPITKQTTTSTITAETDLSTITPPSHFLPLRRSQKPLTKERSSSLALSPSLGRKSIIDDRRSQLMKTVALKNDTVNSLKGTNNSTTNTTNSDINDSNHLINNAIVSNDPFQDQTHHFSNETLERKSGSPPKMVAIYPSDDLNSKDQIISKLKQKVKKASRKFAGETYTWVLNEIDRQRFQSSKLTSTESRLKAKRLLHNYWYKCCCILCILMHVVSAALFSGDLRYAILSVTAEVVIESILLAFFIIDMGLNIFVDGVWYQESAYFKRDKFNILNGFIILFSFLELILNFGVYGSEDPSEPYKLQFAAGSGITSAICMIFSASRGLRPLRFIKFDLGLRAALSSLVGSVRELPTPLVLCGIVYIGFCVSGMQLFAGRYGNCSDPHIIYRSECSGSNPAGDDLEWDVFDRNFDSLGNAALSMFEVTVGEAWVRIMTRSADVAGVGDGPVENKSIYFSLFFLFFIALFVFCLINVLTSAVLGGFLANKNNHAGSRMMAANQRRWLRTINSLSNLAEKMWPDINPAKTMKWIYSYRWNNFMGFIAFLHLCFLAIYSPSDSNSLISSTVAQNSHLVFTIIYAVERVMICVAAGRKQFKQTLDLCAWISLILCYLAWILEASRTSEYDFDGVCMRVLAVFIIYRVIFVIGNLNFFRSLRSVLSVLLLAMPSMINMIFFIAVFMMVFGIAGQYLFTFASDYVANNSLDSASFNFKKFPNALLVLLYISTGEDWQAVLADCYRITPIGSGIFFSLFMMLMFFILFQLFIAILHESLEFAAGTYSIDKEGNSLENTSAALLLRRQDLHRFKQIWLLLDKDMSMTIHIDTLPLFLLALPEPLGLWRPGDSYFLFGPGERRGRRAVRRLMWNLPIPLIGSNGDRISFYHVMRALLDSSVEPELSITVRAVLERRFRRSIRYKVGLPPSADFALGYEYLEEALQNEVTGRVLAAADAVKNHAQGVKESIKLHKQQKKYDDYLKNKNKCDENGQALDSTLVDDDNTAAVEAESRLHLSAAKTYASYITRLSNRLQEVFSHPNSNALSDPVDSTRDTEPKLKKDSVISIDNKNLRTSNLKVLSDRPSLKMSRLSQKNKYSFNNVSPSQSSDDSFEASSNIDNKSSSSDFSDDSSEHGGAGLYYLKQHNTGTQLQNTKALQNELKSLAGTILDTGGNAHDLELDTKRKLKNGKHLLIGNSLSARARALQTGTNAPVVKGFVQSPPEDDADFLKSFKFANEMEKARLKEHIDNLKVRNKMAALNMIGRSSMSRAASDVVPGVLFDHPDGHLNKEGLFNDSDSETDDEVVGLIDDNELLVERLRTSAFHGTMIDPAEGDWVLQGWTTCHLLAARVLQERFRSKRQFNARKRLVDQVKNKENSSNSIKLAMNKLKSAIRVTSALGGYSKPLLNLTTSTTTTTSNENDTSLGNEIKMSMNLLDTESDSYNFFGAPAKKSLGNPFTAVSVIGRLKKLHRQQKLNHRGQTSSHTHNDDLSSLYHFLKRGNTENTTLIANMTYPSDNLHSKDETSDKYKDQLFDEFVSLKEAGNDDIKSVPSIPYHFPAVNVSSILMPKRSSPPLPTEEKDEETTLKFATLPPSDVGQSAWNFSAGYGDEYDASNVENFLNQAERNSRFSVGENPLSLFYPPNDGPPLFQDSNFSTVLHPVIDDGCHANVDNDEFKDAIQELNLQRQPAYISAVSLPNDMRNLFSPPDAEGWKYLHDVDGYTWRIRDGHTDKLEWLMEFDDGHTEWTLFEEQFLMNDDFAPKHAEFLS